MTAALHDGALSRPRPVLTGLVGVLGGMGPAATADFFAKLVAATPATTDQEHLRVMIWSDPTVPDRSAALLHGGADPTRMIEQGATILAAAGADLIVIPCNTAHAFLAGLSERVGVPVMHMIEEAVRRLRAQVPTATRVGLLATTGTVTAGLYQAELSRAGVEVVLPDAAGQARVMEAIAAVKAGGDLAYARGWVTGVTDSLVARDVHGVIAGCTEIPLLLGPEDVAVPVIDPAVALAEAVVSSMGTP